MSSVLVSPPPVPPFLHPLLIPASSFNSVYLISFHMCPTIPSTGYKSWVCDSKLLCGLWYPLPLDQLSFSPLIFSILPHFSLLKPSHPQFSPHYLRSTYTPLSLHSDCASFPLPQPPKTSFYFPGSLLCSKLSMQTEGDLQMRKNMCHCLSEPELPHSLCFSSSICLLADLCFHFSLQQSSVPLCVSSTFFLFIYLLMNT